MRTWQSVGVALAGLTLCLALAGCGASSFGWSTTCPSATDCQVVLQDPASNSDPSSWTVTASDSRVRIEPSHGVIAPGQTVTVKVTLPADACDIQLTGTSQDAVWPLGLGGGSGFGATVPDQVMPGAGAAGTCAGAQAKP